MQDILIVKTGALGDVLRTTSILPGLRGRFPEASIAWLTAPGAVDLVRLHPDVSEVLLWRAEEGAPAGLLDRAFDWVISLDDEAPLCALASRLEAGKLSGAFLDEAGARAYTPDVAPWFDMGLLSVHGKEEADRRKVANTRSHPDIFASMLGIERGEPILPLPPEAEAFAREFVERTGLRRAGPVIGLNTGAGGRWHSKALPIERVAELVRKILAELSGGASFLVLGGPSEVERNRALLAEIGSSARVVHAGTDNPVHRFAALVSACDVLVSSDSLALHVGVARRVPTVAFFAPTSAAEIELYGRGEKVVSESPDYCSYRPDADTSTLTADRLRDAVLRQLAGRRR